MQKRINILVNGQTVTTIVFDFAAPAPGIKVDSKLTSSEAIGRSILLGLIVMSASIDQETIDLNVNDESLAVN